MTGLLGKLSGAWNTIKSVPGIAGNMIKRAGGAVGNFIKNNAETLEKVGGAALSAGLNAYTGGQAYPFISGANSLIQSLPDNSFTKHLKNISKAAAFDFSSDGGESSNAQTGGGTFKNKDKTKPKVEMNNNQSNGLTEYKSLIPVMSHFISSSGQTPILSVPRSKKKTHSLTKRRKNMKKSKGKSQKTKGK